jgi:hypothetical protein
MDTPDEASSYLLELRDAYVWKVNAALERGQEQLAAELAEQYLADVREALEAGPPP